MSINLNALNVNALTSLTPVSETVQSKDTKRLEGAAKQFEALMISQMMKTSRESSGGGWLNEGDETGEDSTMGMAEDQFAQAMASSGGLGLAKMVVRTMTHAEKGDTESAVTSGNPASQMPTVLPSK